jgi:hypothetical protein
MKSLLMISTVCLLACNQTGKTVQLQKQVDSLKLQLANTYKPGLGEFMSGIQIHHAKLWFAGQNENWKLANFELNEIKEVVETIQKSYPGRDESKMLLHLFSPVLDSMDHAIQQMNISVFKNTYVLLTNTCNNCHHVAGFAFNVVTIPSAPPFSNQDFKIK